MFHTYIIYSKSKDSYYIGHTGVGVEKRLQRHNAGWSQSTKSGTPWELVYKKSFDTKSEAIKRENFIKRQKSRDFIEKLITSEENELIS